MNAVIEARSLNKRAGRATLLDGVGLTVAAGEMVAIIGPNGAGKSTLLRLLSGDLRPSAGEVRLKQRDISSFTPRELAAHRAMLSQHINVTFPSPSRRSCRWAQASAARARLDRSSMLRWTRSG